jgi:hypothetical protein
MKRLLVVTVLLALGVFLVFSLVAAQTVAPTGFAVDKSAEGPVSPSAITPRTSHTLVQNMENVQANLHIQYYRDNGTIAKEFDDVLPANGSKTYHANTYPELGASFLGSMVVSSDRQIVAVVVNAGSTSHDIYEGANQGATEEFLPSVHWKAAQYTLTGFQNTDPSVTATVAISYFKQDGTLLNAVTVPIAPNSAIHQDARSYATDPSGVGSIKATSLTGQKIALAAIETLVDETYSYRGFMPEQGATTVFLPSVHRNLGGQFSHTLVQNMSNQTNNVRITYYKQDGTMANTFTKLIAANGAFTFHTGPGFLEDPVALGNVGSAKLESLDGRQMVAVVVETVGTYAYAYDGQTMADSANSVLFPSAHRNLGGQFSHTLVQNLSTSGAANLTVTYYKQDGTVANVFNKTLAASGSYTFHTGPGFVEDPTNLGNVGSLRVACTNCTTGGTQIVAVMVETLSSAQITAAYAGFKEN